MTNLVDGRPRHYILDGHTPVAADLMTWARWFETNFDNRIVAKSRVWGCEVSTVFLGLDHQWGGGPPLLFETLVFGGPLDGKMYRVTTWEEAEAAHKAMSTSLRLDMMLYAPLWLGRKVIALADLWLVLGILAVVVYAA